MFCSVLKNGVAWLVVVCFAKNLPVWSSFEVSEGLKGVLESGVRDCRRILLFSRSSMFWQKEVEVGMGARARGWYSSELR